MSDDTDAAREYDRLRSELADFVLGAMSESIARGDQPELSKALVDAIDRRIDERIAARLESTEWPDPEAFAEAVLAAASRGDRTGSASRARQSDEEREERRTASPTARGPTRGQTILIAVIGIALVAAITYFVLRSWNTPVTNTVVVNAQTFEPASDPAFNGANQQLPPTDNAAAPSPPANLQEQPR